MTHDAPGHSYLELLAVLAIGGTVAAISLPALRREPSLASAARRIVEILDSARLFALQEQRKFSVRLEGDELFPESGESRRQGLRLPPGVRLATSDGTPATLEFHPSGAATPRTLVLERDGMRCRIVVSLRARVRWSCP